MLDFRKYQVSESIIDNTYSTQELFTTDTRLPHESVLTSALP